MQTIKMGCDETLPTKGGKEKSRAVRTELRQSDPVDNFPDLQVIAPLVRRPVAGGFLNHADPDAEDAGLQWLQVRGDHELRDDARAALVEQPSA